jgi:hypothetical protein
MAIENRTGTCTLCGGPVYRYPNPAPGGPDMWAHTNRADWIDNPHPISPQESE